MRIRTATSEDAEELLAIYAPYVTGTAITFEYDVPTVEEFRARIERTLESYPYLVAVNESGRIAGYAYAGPFHARPAYDWAVETSIYVNRTLRKHGIGGLLHDALKQSLQKMGVQNMCACITVVPEGKSSDPYVTNNSMGFHEHLGYHLVGRFHRCGYKFNRWYDMVWMELMIGDHPVPAPELKRASCS